MDKPLLIVGCGSIGSRHLRNLLAMGYTNIVLYRTGKGASSGNEFLDFPVEHNLKSALAHHPIGVIVSNPTALHIPIALAAVKANCHLFIEKPFSNSMKGVEKLQREAKRRNVCILVGYQFRFNPGLRQIKKWLDTRAIGKVVSVHAHWGEYLPDWHPWEDYRKGYSARSDLGGGVVLTLSHPFDYLRWLIGEVASVSAMTRRLSGLGIDVEDTSQVMLRFASGAIGSVYLDYIERPPNHRLYIICQKGTICWNNNDSVAHLYNAETTERKKVRPPRGFQRNTMFMNEMRHFLNCLFKKEKPVCTLYDGIRTLKICLAAKKSAVIRREVDV